MNPRKIFITFLLLLPVVLLNVFSSEKTSAQSSCPSYTTFTDTQATLVGEITDHGGDPNLEVWFKWGRTSDVPNETYHQSIYASSLPYRFCATISNLQPCTTYFYQAVARNSAGTSYGRVESFRTKCAQVSVDLKANGSDGPITIIYGETLTLSWTSRNADSCVASGAWSGNKPTSGTETISNLKVGSHTFTLTCTGANGTTASDSVTVNVRARLPQVRTLPAVETL